MLKENCSEYSLLEKVHNALFYSVLVYIHQLHMLSHVKYRNSIFKQIEKNLIIYAPQCSKQNCSEYYLSLKNIQCPILLCFGVYTPTPYALSCKIEKFHIYANQKKI